MHIPEHTFDSNMPVRAFRIWLIGISLTVTSASVNTLVDFRSLQVYLPSHVLKVQQICLSALVDETLMNYPWLRVDYSCILWPI